MAPAETWRLNLQHRKRRHSPRLLSAVESGGKEERQMEKKSDRERTDGIHWTKEFCRPNREVRFLYEVTRHKLYLSWLSSLETKAEKLFVFQSEARTLHRGSERKRTCELGALIS